jgi:hypothetical protein
VSTKAEAPAAAARRQAPPPPVPQPRPAPVSQKATVAAPVAAAPTAQAMWHVQTADGTNYGPVTKADLDTWVTDERLDAQCQLLMDGWDQWKWAEDVYPQLAAPSAEPQLGLEVRTDEPDEFPTATEARNPYAAPTTRGGGGTRPIAEAHEPDPADDGWIYAKIGLSISQFSLMSGGVSVLLIGIAILTMGNMGSSGSKTDTVETAKAMTLFLILGGIAYFASFFTLMTGWTVCTGVPRRTGAKGLVFGALAGVGAGIFFLMILAALGYTSSIDSINLVKVLIWLSQLSLAAGYAVFAFSLGALGRLSNDKTLPKMAIFYAIFEGLVGLWITLCAFAFAVDTFSPSTHITILMILGLVTNAWLAWMTIMTHGHVNRIVKARS